MTKTTKKIERERWMMLREKQNNRDDFQD